VRVLSATNADLRAMVKAGAFREDLFYRLNLIELKLPALAERRDDVLPLAEHFLAGRGRFGEAAREALLVHRWPGNVRELKNAVERAALLCQGGEITPALLGLDEANGNGNGNGGAYRNLDEPSREAVVAALAAAGGVVSRAATQLGLSRQALYRRLERYGIEP
jgi:DNA-binding NtrC family response regulator